MSLSGIRHVSLYRTIKTKKLLGQNVQEKPLVTTGSFHTHVRNVFYTETLNHVHL